MNDHRRLAMLLAFRADLARIVGEGAPLPCSDAWNDFAEPLVKARSNVLRSACRAERAAWRHRAALLKQGGARR
jgi:hypothetical protein